MAKDVLDLWPTMAVHRQPWPAMVGHGRSMPAMAKVGTRPESNPSLLISRPLVMWWVVCGCSGWSWWSYRGLFVVVVAGPGGRVVGRVWLSLVVVFVVACGQVRCCWWSFGCGLWWVRCG